MDYVDVYQAGLRCYADASIRDESGHLFLVSIFGRPSLVKAIAAGFISGRGMTFGGVTVIRPSTTLQVVTQNLDEGLAHKLIFAPDLFTGANARILIGEDRKAAFRLLDSAVSTPLKEDWSDFLWDAVFDPSRLIGFGQINGKDLSDVYLVSVNKTTEEVDALILEEIQSGRLQ